MTNIELQTMEMAKTFFRNADRQRYTKTFCFKTSADIQPFGERIDDTINAWVKENHVRLNDIKVSCYDNKLLYTVIYTK